MYNMRIDVVRKELERRFRDVEKLFSSSQTRIPFSEVCKITEPYIHFLLSDPFITQFVTGLTKYRESFLSSDSFKEIEKCIVQVVKDIASKIDEIGFFTSEFQANLPQKLYLNVFDLMKPDDDSRYLTAQEFYKALKDLGRYSSKALSASIYIDEIFCFIDHVINAGKNHVSGYPLEYFNSLYQRFCECNERYVAFYNYQAEYEGANAATRLIVLYMTSPYRHISNLKREELGDLYAELIIHSDEGDQNRSNNDYMCDCKTLYHAVDKYLLTGKSKSALIARLKTYCTWFRLEEFWKEGIKESDISKIIEEYIFSLGYYPIVNPRAGRSIYDILAEPGENLSWDNSVLIELKQYIGKSYSSKQFEIDIGQARDYLSIVKGVKPDLDDFVYLLVFYSGDNRYYLDNSFSDDKVQVEFIYVGKKTPSTLKGEKKFGGK